MRFESRTIDVRRALLIGLPLLALVPKFWIITHWLYPGDRSVFDTGFGFGGYIRSLAEQGAFRTCSSLPFMPCTPATCVFATRMPGIPLLLAALAKVFGTRSAAVALAKCSAFALLSSGFLAVLSRDVRLTAMGLLTIYVMYFGPQALKHAATLDYEEGVLVDLSLCLAVAIAYLLRPELTASPQRRAVMALAAVLIATVMYFTKTTALLTLLLVLALVLTVRFVPLGVKAVSVAVVAVAALGWGAHNLISSGSFSVSSSWNGENLYRGYDSGALAIYPQIHLDRIFDSPIAILDDGSTVTLGNYRNRQCFRDEWTWSSSYSHMAWEWLQAHPYDAVVFLAKKTWVALFEVRHTPKYLSATEKIVENSGVVNTVMMGWMLVARLAFFALIVRIGLDLYANRHRSYAWALALLGGLCAPYLLVFAYQRHLTPVLIFAGTLLVLLYATQPVAAQPKGARERLVGDIATQL